MGRGYRAYVHQDHGSYHIISRVAGGGFLFNGGDKEYFVNLMFKLAKGYFVDIISYTVMSIKKLLGKMQSILKVLI